MPMTKAEAVCACNNIITLVEDLDEVLTEKGREDYARSVHDRMADMRKFILEQWRGGHVTEKMDGAIRNTWEGLRKWDHEDIGVTDLFDGLDDVIMELERLAPSGLPSDQQASTKPQKGREVVEPVAAAPAPAAPAATTAAAAPRTPRPAPQPAPAPVPSSGTNGQPAGLGREALVKARERALGTVRSQIQEKAIRVIDDKVIQHADLAHILNMTKSDRTRQLILAAFYAGKNAGIHALARDLLGE